MMGSKNGRRFLAVVALVILRGSVEPGDVFSGQDDAREHLELTDELSAGNLFDRPFGPGFFFRLEPRPFGWAIVIRDAAAADDLARLTPPFHFVPNPRDIEGWHFRNADNTGPNEPGDKNVNAPGVIREFIFSPEVGITIAGPGSTGPVTEQDVERVKRFGRGTLTILDYRLADAEPGKTARFEWVRFRVELSWPALSLTPGRAAIRPLSSGRPRFCRCAGIRPGPSSDRRAIRRPG